MAKKISELDTISSIASDDLLVIVDTSGSNTNKTTVSDLFGVALGQGCRVYNNLDITITHNTDTPLTFNSERWDTDGIHSTSGSTGYLICQTPGYYIITGHVQFEGNTAGHRQIWISLNGTTDIGRVSMNPYNITPPARICITTVYYLDAGEYVELYVYQSSGGNLDVISISNRSPEFSMQRIG